MEARELRIENLVSFYGKRNFPITGISVKTVRHKALICCVSDLEPIPLTVEWLVNFGFEVEEDYYVSVLSYDFGEIKIYPSPNGFFFIEGVIQKHIKSVHELQNLYFALTGDELEFTNV